MILALLALICLILLAPCTGKVKSSSRVYLTLSVGAALLGGFLRYSDRAHCVFGTSNGTSAVQGHAAW